jgi:hypothetical protein
MDIRGRRSWRGRKLRGKRRIRARGELLSTHRMAVERANEAIAVAILGCCDGGFRLDDRIDAANCGSRNGR